MRRILLAAIMVLALAIPVHAMDFQAPEAPSRVADVVDEPSDSFGEGLWNVIKSAISTLDGSLKEAMGVCLGASAAVLLGALLREICTGISTRAVELACTVAVAGMLLEPSSSLITLAVDTAFELSEYGKLLLPVMAGAMAAQGGVTASAALYAGTAMFDSILSAILARLMKPMIYLFLALSIANAALREDLIGKMKDFIQWAMGWILKIALYAFTGYMAVTGVVSGKADASAVRMAKITISSAVPVVGGILSDASEAVLVSAGTLGSAAGVYGMLAVLALFAGPAVRIGAQYLLMKGTGALCGAFDGGAAAGLMEDFSSAMGLALAMVFAQTVMLMISTMCLMKEVG